MNVSFYLLPLSPPFLFMYSLLANAHYLLACMLAERAEAMIHHNTPQVDNTLQ